MFSLLVALCSPTDALAASTPSQTVYQSIIGGALSVTAKYDSIVVALAGYWYEAPAAKRVKVPVHDPYDPWGYGNDLSDYESFDDWYEHFTMPIFGSQGQWEVLGYDDGNRVSEFDPALELVFGDWYDWFNSVDSGSGGGNTQDGSYIRMTLRKSVPANYISSNCSLHGQSYKFGPASPSNLDMSPDTLDVLIPYNLFVTLGTGFDRIIAYVNTSGSVQVMGIKQTYTYGWESISTEKNGVSYTTDVLTMQTGTHKYTYSDAWTWNGSEYVITTNDWNGTASPGSLTIEKAGWYSIVPFDGTYTPVEPSVPDEPIAPPRPTEPEPEQPTEPTIPTLPNIDGPMVNITPGGNESTTTTADLQPILDALRIINSNVAGILTDMQDYETWWFDTFSAYWQSMQGYVNYLGDWFSNISKQIDDTGKLILRELRKANQYLYQLVNKKQSGGGPSIDPVSQPDESWSWWEALIQQLLNALPTAVVQFLQQLSRLNGVFPFSIPWDIGFLLGLFRQSPQTPVFDLAINCSYFQWSAHIDLTAWNALALVVRRGELLAFGMTLITFTPSALKQLEVI